MNGQPHTHEVEVRYRGYGSQRWVVEYGDTKVYCFFEKRIPKAIERAIRKHDKGSIVAQARQDRINLITSYLHKDKWGSETLAKKEPAPEEPKPEPKNDPVNFNVGTSKPYVLVTDSGNIWTTSSTTRVTSALQ